jgi:hypothetical protein
MPVDVAAGIVVVMADAGMTPVVVMMGAGMTVAVGSTVRQRKNPNGPDRSTMA